MKEGAGVGVYDATVGATAELQSSPPVKEGAGLADCTLDAIEGAVASIEPSCEGGCRVIWELKALLDA